MRRITIDNYGGTRLPGMGDKLYDGIRLDVEYDHSPAEKDTDTPEVWEIFSVRLDYGEFACEVDLLNKSFSEKNIVEAIKEQVKTDRENHRIDQSLEEDLYGK